MVKLHTCKVPGKALDEWLERYTSVTKDGRYGHLLLEQKAPTTPDALRPYFASAHSDARAYFDSQIGMDLHPDSGDPVSEATYPKCLPPKARRGLFGEVMAGLVTEHFQGKFVGKHPWSVPIFLFRYHADVEVYLFDLARDPTQKREVWGRFGSDFIGLSFNKSGEVVRFIAGEAKWRKTLIPSVVDRLLLGKLEKKDGKQVRADDGIWTQLNRKVNVPHGVRQLQRLLKERAPDEFAECILSLDRALLAKGAKPLPRTNFVLIAGNAAKGREASQPLIGWKELPAEYTAPHDLQVVELILEDGETLIDGIYDTIWDGDL
jgi:hypothetical protein